ncbi:MAG: hypothetical protein AAF492_24770, partial [Verrucomicrobiota bacterium]
VNLTYTIGVTNRSLSSVSGIEVRDHMPAGLALLSSVPPADQTNGNEFVFHVGALAAGSGTSIVIQAELVSMVPQTLTNLVFTTNAPGEMVTNNNRDTAVTVVGDFDGDGLTNPFDPDDDNDNMADDDELVAGTRPFDETSFFWVHMNLTQSQYVHQVTFPGVAAHTYHVQSTTNLLSDTWTDERAGVAGSNGLMSVFITNLNPRVYFRVGVE